MEQIVPATDLDDFARAINLNGLALWNSAVDDEELRTLREACAENVVAEASSVRSKRLYARRNLLADVPAMADLARSESLRSLVRAVLGSEFTVVRALLFDKVPEANWHVGWHQDLMIPLAARHDVPGFTSWSVKAGMVHAKPPTQVLEQMLTLRVHLDDCGSENGPLRLIAGGHERGEVSAEQLRAIGKSKRVSTCIAKAGDVLAMRPLIPHASSPATQPNHRRVVHLEYARFCLPEPLRWPEWSGNCTGKMPVPPTWQDASATRFGI